MRRQSCRLLLVCLLICLSGGAVAAQSDGLFAAADSARVARESWGRAEAALRKEDTATGLRELEHADSAWPTQPAYPWGVAVVATHAGDTAAVKRGLLSYAALGLGRNLHADKRFAPYIARRDFADIVRRHDANRAPLVRSTVRATLPDSTFWPEGMDYDARTRRFYVAGVRHRTIVEISPDGTSRELLQRDQHGNGAVLGVRMDTARGVLWATMSGIVQTAGYVPADSAIAALVRVRISDGAIEKRWNIPPTPGGHTLGDLAIGPHGDVFLTDSNQPVLYRLRPGADSLEHFSSPLFFSLQGVVPTPDGRALYLADYSHGLLRVDLTTNDVVRVGDAPHSTSLGCDGLAWDRGARSIVCVQNGVAPARVMCFVLDATGRRIVQAIVLDRNPAIADEPTIGAIAGPDFVYVANSQWEKFDEKGVQKDGVRLTAPVLLAVPLGR